MKVQSTIQKWGNSLAIRITGPLKTIPHFTADMPIEIEVSEKGLSICPIAPKKTKINSLQRSSALKRINS